MKKRDKTRWDRRERKKAKLKNGMQVDGRSILTIQDVIKRKAKELMDVKKK